ncbi:histidine biosynthesis protein [Pyrolobus fumarii 1A]|uniref:1-(5-phosphoribosyl)-5-[(5-phosphoribosylamino)methylideneamino] imidazole-4-carboxamide isomerase n=1 Tax=Pyrolobus fumarii (strain DSM 11204 / 1A) TaxID=694429 RepID=G0EH84_PYRF1|nr:1-(5-phosphoribosyl)-5-[(5-phosphoribosylamino)methylideneamino] imidazole-4-carboxamide isomerase [Pyrolobus fumarii]AEM39308.1 histidine biosynthesis protein [Pyrolobus fumarii 1A]
MPSLDLEAGRVVKRVEGVKGTGLVVGSPLEVAKRLWEKGVEWLHVVDLDGAEAGKPVNVGIAESLVRMGFHVQYGGGIRAKEHVELLLDKIGVERVVIGTLVHRNPRLVEDVVEEYGGDRIVAALDAKWGMVVIEGWRKEAKSLRDMLDLVYGLGVRQILYTSVEREGKLTGADLERVAWLRGVWPYGLQYAGGIATIDDILGLAELGVDAAILGMAFHAGLLDVVEASVLAARV